MGRTSGCEQERRKDQKPTLGRQALRRHYGGPAMATSPVSRSSTHAACNAIVDQTATVEATSSTISVVIEQNSERSSEQTAGDGACPSWPSTPFRTSKPLEQPLLRSKLRSPRRRRRISSMNSNV